VPRPFAPVKLPPLEQQDGSSYPRLVALMQRLMAPDGCPWDRKQTMESLRRYVVEEACEVVDAIDDGDRKELCGELGDLLLQVVFLSELARGEKSFGPDDVVAAIVEKLVRRHPHVFADVEVDGAEEVLTNWERIKAEERRRDGKKGGLLSSVPRGLPALTRAQRVGEKSATVGFDWPDTKGPREQLDEEIGELDEALGSKDQEAIEEEFGDVLFSVVNMARHHGVDAEAALRNCVKKYIDRFGFVEAKVRDDHGGWPERALPIEELDSYWRQAKESK